MRTASSSPFRIGMFFHSSDVPTRGRSPTRRPSTSANGGEPGAPSIEIVADWEPSLASGSERNSTCADSTVAPAGMSTAGKRSPTLAASLESGTKNRGSAHGSSISAPSSSTALSSIEPSA